MNDWNKITTPILYAAWAIVFLAQPVFSQESAVSDESQQGTDASGNGDSQSGYEDIAEFGGPESVGTRLKENDAERDSRYRFDGLQRTLGPYFDWKREVKEDHSVSFGSSLYLLYQKASDSLPGQEDDALGHIFRYQGAWNLFQRDNGNSGRIA